MNKNLFKLLIVTLAFSTIAKADDLVAKGQAVYTTSCNTCHGPQFDGKGDAGKYLNPPPRNLVTGKFVNGDSADQIFKTVTEGLKNTSMASFASLPEADRKAVAAYVASLRKKK